MTTINISNSFLANLTLNTSIDIESPNNFSDEFLKALFGDGTLISGEQVHNCPSNATNNPNLPSRSPQNNPQYNTTLPQYGVQCQNNSPFGMSPMTSNRFGTNAYALSLPTAGTHPSHDAQIGKVQIDGTNKDYIISDARIDTFSMNLGEIMMKYCPSKEVSDKENHITLPEVEILKYLNLGPAIRKFSPEARRMFALQIALNEKCLLDVRRLFLDLLDIPLSFLSAKATDIANEPGASPLINTAKSIPAIPQEDVTALNTHTPDTVLIPAEDLPNHAFEVTPDGYEETLMGVDVPQYQYSPNAIDYTSYPGTVTPEMIASANVLDQFNSLPDAGLNLQVNPQAPYNDHYANPELILDMNFLDQQSVIEQQNVMGQQSFMENYLLNADKAFPGQQLVASPVDDSNLGNTFGMDPSFANYTGAFANSAQQLSNSPFVPPYQMDRSFSQESSSSLPSLTSSLSSSPTFSLNTPPDSEAQFNWNLTTPSKTKASKAKKPRNNKKPYSRPKNTQSSYQNSYVAEFIPMSVAQSTGAVVKTGNFSMKKQKNAVLGLTEYDPILTLLHIEKIKKDSKGELGPVQCPICDGRFSSGLQRHLFSHSPLGKIFCACGSHYARIDSLRRHCDVRCSQRISAAEREEKMVSGILAHLRTLNIAGRGSLEDEEFKSLHKTFTDFRLACQNAALFLPEDADQATLEKRNADAEYIENVYIRYASYSE